MRVVRKVCGKVLEWIISVILVKFFRFKIDVFLRNMYRVGFVECIIKKLIV